MKKRLIVLSAFIMLAAALSFSAFAAEVASGECGENAVWKLDDNGTLTISGAGLPEFQFHSDGNAAYKTNIPWFEYRKSIKNVIVEEGITHISSYIFWECNMSSISLPDSVKSIGQHAFWKCKNLKSVTLGKSIENIMYGAFIYCEGLVSVTIKNPKVFLGEYVFYGCNSVEQVNYVGSEHAWKECLGFSTSDDGLENANFTYHYEETTSMPTLAIPTLNKKLPMICIDRNYSILVSLDGKMWIWGGKELDTPTNIMNDVADVSAKEYNILAIKNDKTLWYMEFPNEPEKIMDDVVYACASYSRYAAIKTDGSLWMWGSAYLGDGSSDSSSTPIKIMDNVASVSLGKYHSAALKTDGTLWVWGNNQNTRVGHGSDVPYWIQKPVHVLSNVVSVSLGYNYSTAIKSDGSLWTWGSNGYGQVGNGSAKTSNIPVKILDEVKSVSLGSFNASAVKKDGSLWVWGVNEYKNFGFYSRDKKVCNPVKIMDGVDTACVNDKNVEVLKNDGTLWIVGPDFNGSKGDGKDRNYNCDPVKILDNISKIALGDEFGAAISNDGILYMWGNNEAGQLGNNTIKYSGYPIETEVSLGCVSVYLNDERIKFDVPPVIEDNRTLVPIRAIFEAMGMVVDWDGATSTITATGNGNTIIMRINDTKVIVNGKERITDVPAKIINNRTMVPVRFVSESLNAYVNWDNKTRRIDITYEIPSDYKEFLFCYEQKIDAYYFDSGYYSDSSVVLPIFFGFDDKYDTSISGILRVWEDNINQPLLVRYDFTNKPNGHWENIEISFEDGTLLKDSIYNDYFNKTTIQMTCRDGNTYVNLEDLSWLTGFDIVNDYDILPETLSNTVSSVIENDFLSNPVFEGNLKWGFDSAHLGWSDQQLEKYISSQELWGDIALGSLALFDGEPFGLFEQRINEMVDILVMPSDYQLAENIEDSLALTEAGEVVANIGTIVFDVADELIDSENFPFLSDLFKRNTDMFIYEGNITIKLSEAYFDTVQEFLSIQAIIQCSESNRKELEEFIEYLPDSYKEQYPKAFEIISKRLKQYDNNKYGCYFVDQVLKKGFSFVVSEVTSAIVENAGGKYSIGQLALSLARGAIDVFAGDILQGMKDEGVFHALYDFSNLSTEYYTELWNARNEYVRDFPTEYQNKIKLAAVFSIKSSNDARKCFIKARTQMLSDENLKKNKVGHDSLLEFCKKIDSLIYNEWFYAKVE